MPTYEYRCDRGHTFEVFQRMSDDPLTTCTACDSSVRRVLHPVAVHFKGSGFYNTDYGKQRRGRSDGDGEGGADSGGDAKQADESKGPKDSKAAADEPKGSGSPKASGDGSSSKTVSSAGSASS